MSLLLPQYRAAFIHVPRTGGTVMTDQLGSFTLHQRGHTPRSKMDIPDGWFSFGFVRNPWARHLSFYQAFPSGPFDRYLSTCVSAWSYLAPGVTFIGRFENLQEDWGKIAERLNLPGTLPLLNADFEPVTDYRSHYTDIQAQIVAERCRDDIERFGYTF